MALMLRPASRKQAKLRIGFSGPSGSGKTYSALLLASGIAPWDKIAVVDAENNSAELYSHLGPFQVLPLDAPYSPDRYIEAIKACEKAGMEVIILDSASHEWDGVGGCLEIHERMGGQYRDWAKVTPLHRAFVEKILESHCHIFTTTRRKQDYAMQTNDKGRTEVVKLGMKEVQREGFEYELTMAFEIDQRNYARASKDRTGLFASQPPFKISQDTGYQILEWNQSGAAPLPQPASATVVTPSAPKPAPTPSGASPVNPLAAPVTAASTSAQKATDLQKQIFAVAKAKGWQGVDVKEWIREMWGVESTAFLSAAQAGELIDAMDTHPNEAYSKIVLSKAKPVPGPQPGPLFTEGDAAL